MIEQIENLPELSFYDDVTLDNIKADLKAAYEQRYAELTGKSIILTDSDPAALMLYACAVQIFQQMIYVDKAGKMNFLKYSYGEFLDNLGALRGIERKGAQRAETTVRFSLSIVRPSTVIIPIGTKVATADRIYFETTEYAEIRSGQTFVDVPCSALEEGLKANGVKPGDISILVNTIAYIAGVTNLTESSGGLDVETDESFKDRIYLSKSASTAGTEDAYKYAVQSAYPDVSDVHVFSPSASCVSILFLVGDGEIPSPEIIQRVADALEDDSVKPMTDKVTVSAPAVQNYDVNIEYFVDSSNSSRVAAIQDSVVNSVKEYTDWQDKKIGRDINPSKLIQYCMQAGAKRVEVTSPGRIVIDDSTVARIQNVTVNYGGLEHD